MWNPVTLLLKSSNDEVRATAARLAKWLLPSENRKLLVAGMQACILHLFVPNPSTLDTTLDTTLVLLMQLLITAGS